MTTSAKIEQYIFLTQHPANMLRKFIPEPTPFQLNLLDLFLSEGPVPFRSVSKQHRCVGFTTAVAAFMVWYALKHHNRLIVNIDVMHKHQYLSRLVMDMIDQLDAEFRFSADDHGMYHRRNKSEIDLTNGSRILFRSTSTSALRGMTVSLAILNDIPTDSELFQSAYPAMACSRHGLMLQLYEDDPPEMADLVTTAQDMLR